MRTSLKKIWRDLQWPFLGALALALLVLGVVGFSKYFIALGQRRPLANLVYLSIQLFVLESGSVPGPVPWQLDLARFLAPLVAGYAAVKGFALIFREQLRMLRLRFLANHTVVCGLGRTGLRLVRQFRGRNDRVVVIEKDGQKGSLDQARDLGATVLIGDAADPEVLRRAGCPRAARLVSVCGNDSINAEAASQAGRLVPADRHSILTCGVHIVDPRLCGLLAGREIETGRGGAFRLEFFNIFEVGARSWLNEYPPFGRAGDGGTSRPHLLVVGVGNLGESLIAQTARRWDSSTRPRSERLALTIVDRLAESKRDLLFLKYPSLEQCCDLAALQMDVGSPLFERADFLVGDARRGDVTSVFICLDDDSLGLSAALALRPRLRDPSVPLVVRTTHREALSGLLQEEAGCGRRQAVIRSFDLLGHISLADLALGGTKERLAQAVHEKYVREQRKIGQSPETNPAMLAWEDLPETLKESNRNHADHIGIKLRAVGCGIEIATDWREPLFAFSDAEIERMARLEHDRWLRERVRGGWRSGTKDVGERRTPYLVPWEDLTEDLKDRDRAFIRELPSFLAGAGFRICRVRPPSP
jgi:TrkA-N domain/RyR domain